MTTVTADIINASTFGNPVNVRRLIHNDPTDPTKQFILLSSNQSTNSNASLTSFAGLSGNNVVTFPDIDGQIACTVPTNVFTAPQSFGVINVQSSFIGTPEMVAQVNNDLNIRSDVANGTVKIENVEFGYNTQQIGLVYNSAINYTVKGTAPAATTATITTPNFSFTPFTIADVGTYTALQTYQGGIKTNTITGNTVNADINFIPNGTGSVIANGFTFSTNSVTAKTTNSDFSLVNNGTGSVVLNTPLKVNTITAKTTNSDITLSGNGTGGVLLNSTLLTNTLTAKTTNGDLSLSGSSQPVFVTSQHKVDTITGQTTNSDLTITPFGSTSVSLTGTKKVNTITAKTTNGNLSLAGNGTGVVAFGSTGLKFANETLKDYEIGVFTSQITCGTFNSGNISVQFERIGKKVTLRVPVVTGTPNISATWSGSNLPASIQPANTQLLNIGSVVVSSSFRTLGYCKIQAASSTYIISAGSDVGTFGATGVNGWDISWVITYLL